MSSVHEHHIDVFVTAATTQEANQHKIFKKLCPSQRRQTRVAHVDDVSTNSKQQQTTTNDIYKPIGLAFFEVSLMTQIHPVVDAIASSSDTLPHNYTVLH
jgi:hypothetical protein